MSFKAKPVRSTVPAQSAGADLSDRLRDVTRGIPAATTDTRPTPGSDDEAVQINFKGSRAMARVLHELKLREGSTRRVIARLLIADGYPELQPDLQSKVHSRFYGPAD